MAGYDFTVPLLAGDHVTDDTGTGFVHTAPGHGREDFDVWTANAPKLAARGINTHIPYTVDADGRFTDQAPGFTGKRVLTEKGEKGDANEAVIKALIDAGMLIARGRLKHQYPHSWRSKKPVIFRNTPQWFIAMDKEHRPARRHAAPSRARRRSRRRAGCRRQGENRINGMIESRPDWVISRQRAWGVPITLFIKEKPDGSVDILDDPEVQCRASSRRSRRRAPTPGTRRARASVSSASSPTTAGRRSTTFSTSGSIPARRTLSCWRTRKHFPALAHIKRKADGGDEDGDVSRRLRPASRLVSVLAAGKLRHARPRAVRRRAHPRLRARRGRAQNVEVARQRHRAAGRDQTVRRRHSAHVGVRRRLRRRSAHRAGNPQDHGRHLSQAAQHAALDARQSRAFRGSRSGRCRKKCPSSSG